MKCHKWDQATDAAKPVSILPMLFKDLCSSLSGFNFPASSMNSRAIWSNGFPLPWEEKTILSTLPGESWTIGEGAAGATSGAAVTASDTFGIFLAVVVSKVSMLELAVVTSVAANVVLAVRWVLLVVPVVGETSWWSWSCSNCLKALRPKTCFQTGSSMDSIWTVSLTAELVKPVSGFKANAVIISNPRTNAAAAHCQHLRPPVSSRGSRGPNMHSRSESGTWTAGSRRRYMADAGGKAFTR